MSIPSLRQQLINEALDYHNNMNSVVFNRERKHVEAYGQEEPDKRQSDILIEGQIRDKIAAIMSSIQRVIQSLEYKKSSSGMPNLGTEAEVGPGTTKVTSVPSGKNPEFSIQRRLSDALADIVNQYNSFVEYVNLANRQKAFTQRDIAGIDGIARQLIDPLKSVLGAAAGDVKSEDDINDLQNYTRIYNVIKDMIDKITIGAPYQKVDVGLLTAKVSINEDLVKDAGFDPYGSKNTKYLTTLMNQINAERQRVSNMPVRTQMEKDARKLLADELDRQENKLVSAGYTKIENQDLEAALYKAGAFFTDADTKLNSVVENLDQLRYELRQPIPINYSVDPARFNRIITERFDKLYQVTVSFYRTMEDIRDGFPTSYKDLVPLVRPFYHQYAEFFVDELSRAFATLRRAVVSFYEPEGIPEEQAVALKDLVEHPPFAPDKLKPNKVFGERKKDKDAMAAIGPQGLSNLIRAFIYDDIETLADEISESYERIRNPEPEAEDFDEPDYEEDFHPETDEDIPVAERFFIPTPPTRRPPVSRASRVREAVFGRTASAPRRELYEFDTDEEGFVSPVTDTDEEGKEGEGKPRSKKKRTTKKAVSGGHIHKRHDFMDDKDLEPYLTKHLRPSKYRRNVQPIESSSDESSGIEDGSGSDMEFNKDRVGRGNLKASTKKSKGNTTRVGKGTYRPPADIVRQMLATTTDASKSREQEDPIEREKILEQGRKNFEKKMKEQEKKKGKPQYSAYSGRRIFGTGRKVASQDDWIPDDNDMSPIARFRRKYNKAVKRNAEQREQMKKENEEKAGQHAIGTGKKSRKLKEDVDIIMEMPPEEAAVLIEKKKRGSAKPKNAMKIVQKPAISDTRADKDLWFL